jgi:hypothetical protein
LWVFFMSLKCMSSNSTQISNTAMDKSEIISL